MNHFTTLRTTLVSLLFGLANSLMVAVVAEFSVEFWGRPRGVAYGILGYYQWVFLSIIGLATVTIFRVMPVKYALLTSIGIITIPTIWMMPSIGERQFLSASTAAIMMCLIMGLWTEISNRRRGLRD